MNRETNTTPPGDTDPFAYIFENSVDGIVLVSVQSNKISLYNRAFAVMLGYDRRDFFSLSIHDICPRESIESVVRAFDGLAREETGCMRDIPVNKKDGGMIFVDMSAAPIHFNGEPHVVVTFRDVTERWRAVARLRESEMRYRTLFEEAAVAIAMSRDEKIVFVNKRFLCMFGYVGDAEVIGRSFFSFVAPDSLRNITRLHEQIPYDRTPSHVTEFEAEMLRWDGSHFSIHVSVSTVYLPDGMASFGFITDITERKRAEAEKKQLEAMLLHSQKLESIGRLAGGISHDFNNHLTAIIGNCELAMENLDPRGDSHGNLSIIMKSAQSAANLTRQLLAFSRKQIVEPKIMNLNATVEHIQKMIVTLIGEDIRLKVVPAPELHLIKADPGQIEQIILNLAVNARDAMPDGGTLTIETANVQLDASYTRTHINTTPGAQVMMTVSDTGFGMSGEVLAHCFEPFYTTKPQGKGTGLGLATVHGIVNQSGGSVDVYSEAGKCTVFKVYFPAIPPQAAEENRREAKKTPTTGTETILIVEDNAQILDFCKYALTRDGYTVLTAASGEEALSLAEKYGKPIDLLITDVVLPGINGRLTAQRMLQRHPSMKVLYTSGYTAEIIDNKGFLDQGTNFISKPFTSQEFSAKIREALG
jgi:two-component system, cell cycle sensor histidine kinase and response regulator CckA